jgi:hypothetical protein
MSRIVIVILIYHRHKPIDFICVVLFACADLFRFWKSVCSLLSYLKCKSPRSDTRMGIETVGFCCRVSLMAWLHLQMTHRGMYQPSGYFCSDICFVSSFTVSNWNSEIYIWTAGFNVWSLREEIITRFLGMYAWARIPTSSTILEPVKKMCSTGSFLNRSTL